MQTKNAIVYQQGIMEGNKEITGLLGSLRLVSWIWASTAFVTHAYTFLPRQERRSCARGSDRLQISTCPLFVLVICLDLWFVSLRYSFIVSLYQCLAFDLLPPPPRTFRLDARTGVYPLCVHLAGSLLAKLSEQEHAFPYAHPLHPPCSSQLWMDIRLNHQRS